MAGGSEGLVTVPAGEAAAGASTGCSGRALIEKGKCVTTDSPTTDSPTPTPRQYWGPTHYQPSQPPPYAAPYAPPKKRHRIRNTILIVAAVFVGIGVISAVANGAKSTTH